MKWLDRLGKIQYVAFMVFLAFFLKFIIYTLVYIASELTGLQGLTSLVDDTDFGYEFNLGLIYTGLIIAPTWETMVGQWLPIALVRKVTSKKWVAILLSSLFFAVIHEDILKITGFAVGLILSYTFVTRLAKDKFEAFAMTASIHFFHNLIALTIAYLLM